MITPHEEYDELGKAIGLNGKLFFKREDLHPLGSHKGRSLPIMINQYIDGGFDHFAISSSGNAALASGLYVKELNEKRNDNEKITLEILVGKNISSKKLDKLQKIKDQNILLSIQDRPLQALFTKTQTAKVKSLRQSTDDIALEGYRFLGEELMKIPDLEAVFIGTSSGTTAQALAQYFIDNKKKVEINMVQTTSCHPIADIFDIHEDEKELSIADAIIDRTAFRKNNLIKLIKKNGGTAWIVKNEIIKVAQKITSDNTGLNISVNSALSVTGLMEAIYTGKNYKGSVVCMICGD